MHCGPIWDFVPQTDRLTDWQTDRLTDSQTHRPSYKAAVAAKKEDKQLTKNYRPISLLPICGKFFEKIVFNNLYSYLNTNKLLTKNQSGFRPGDSTTNQLLFLVNEIHMAFAES